MCQTALCAGASSTLPAKVVRLENPSCSSSQGVTINGMIHVFSAGLQHCLCGQAYRGVSSLARQVKLNFLCQGWHWNKVLGRTLIYLRSCKFYVAFPEPLSLSPFLCLIRGAYGWCLPILQGSALPALGLLPTCCLWLQEQVDAWPVVLHKGIEWLWVWLLLCLFENYLMPCGQAVWF